MLERLPGLTPRASRCAASLCEVVLDLDDGVEGGDVAQMSATAAPSMGEKVGYVTPDDPQSDGALASLAQLDDEG